MTVLPVPAGGVDSVSLASVLCSPPRRSHAPEQHAPRHQLQERGPGRGELDENPRSAPRPSAHVFFNQREQEHRARSFSFSSGVPGEALLLRRSRLAAEAGPCGRHHGHCGSGHGALRGRRLGRPACLERNSGAGRRRRWRHVILVGGRDSRVRCFSVRGRGRGARLDGGGRVSNTLAGSVRFSSLSGVSIRGSRHALIHENTKI